MVVAPLALSLLAATITTAASDPSLLVESAGAGLTSSAAASDTVKIEPWGANSLRVRVALSGTPIHEGVGALIKPGSDNKGAVPVPSSVVDVAGSTITNGNIAGKYKLNATSSSAADPLGIVFLGSSGCLLSSDRLLVLTATVGADGLISVSVIPQSSSAVARVCGSMLTAGCLRLQRVSDSAVILKEISRTTAQKVSLDGNPRYSQTSVMFVSPP